MLVIFFFVEFDVDLGLSKVLFHVVVIARGKGIYVHNCTMNEDLVVNQRREINATQSKSYVALARWVKQVSLAAVDSLEQFKRISLFPEINEVFVVFVNSDVGKGPPSSLDFLNRNLVFGLEFQLLLSLHEPSPCPLNLNGCNMVHGESVVLKQPPRQRHLVGRLDQRRTEVPKALVFVLVWQIESTCQELLSELLSGREMAEVVMLLPHESFLVDQVHQLVGVHNGLARP